MDSKPNGKPPGACLRSAVLRNLGGVQMARACERYGVPPAVPAESGERVWRAATVMAERAERERADEIAREGPKSWAEIFAQHRVEYKV